jgi:signal transduction histidine kinase
VALRHQLLLALVVPAIVVIAAMAYFADAAVRRALEASLGDRLMAVGQAAAVSVEDRVLALDRGDEESRVARSTEKKLRDLAASTGVERIMIVRLENFGSLIDTKGELKIGDEYVRARFDKSELEQVARGNGAASVLFRGPEGRWYKTGYAPLRAIEADGAVQGAVVVNAPARFFDLIDDLRKSLGSIALVGMLALGALAFASARRLAVPLQRLSGAAERIGQGELDTDVPLGGPEEAVVLARTMRAMAAALSARDKEMQLMLAGIAHEVRNPLGGIELFGGLLREDLAPDDPRRKSVDKILKEIGVLGSVVNDFLDFARRRPLNPSPTEVKDLLDEIASVLSREAEDKKIALSVEAEPNLSAKLDRDEMRRAILNLAKNGIQATPEGGRVRLLAQRAGTELVVSVEDNGPGVPEGQRAEVWKPFFTTKQKGTGLGLALVKKAVDAHGGTISIDDAPGGGARFVLRLPV